MGVWAADGSAAVKADDFEVTDNAPPKDVDGLFFSHAGDAGVTGGVLRIGTTLSCEEVVIRRGFRGGQYIVEAGD